MPRSSDATHPVLKKESYALKRSRAVAAAASVFAERGYHGATTKDIADRLGIRQGSLYYYFKSKEEALEEVCILALRDYVQRMATIANSKLAFAEKLYEVIYCHLSSYRQPNEALKVHNDQRLYLPAERRERIRNDGSRYRQMLEELFQQEVTNGNMPADTHCSFVTQSVIGLCNAWGDIIIRNDSIDLEDLSARCVDLVLKGVSYNP